MRSRCAATSATSSLRPTAPCPPRPSQSPACHRHAQYTQRHNVVPPLCPNHEHNAQRVLAHVLHALQPHADQPHRHALHLVVLVVGADLPSSQSTAWCCKRLTSGFTFEWKTTCAETTATLTPSHISTPSIHSPAHKRQQQEGQGK
ncbi:hypothetical protein TcCL_Unassigned04072 [Trypanosoma cruzi]|nr:hypothetical protein TcCL_Unassigned04072 [Trypanosoma cruzi]